MLINNIRNCPGQDLALRGLYILFALLILRYKFDIPQQYKTKQDYFDAIPTLFEDVNTPKIGVNVRLRDGVVMIAPSGEIATQQ